MPARDEKFATTRWSLVLAVGEGSEGRARRALGELCELYWSPIYHFLRSTGLGPEEAMECTQGCVVSLLERGSIGSPDRERGRFRGYLLGALKNFLHNEREKARALRRGGGLPPLSIDQARAESGFAFEPHHNRTPETVYLRQWALAVLNETLSALRGRYEADGKGALFERLHPFIAGEKEGGSYRTIGEELGMSEDSIKMAVSRLRRDSSSGVRSARDRTT